MKSTKTRKNGLANKYWLYSDGGGKLGPFTRSEALAVVRESPTTRFRARRDGEATWEEAAVRLASTKRTMGSLWIAVLAVLIISLLGMWWFGNQSHRDTGNRVASLEDTEGQSSDVLTPIVEESIEKESAGAGVRPIATLPR